jgi:hypothetical protein
LASSELSSSEQAVSPRLRAAAAATAAERRTRVERRVRIGIGILLGKDVR